jgi:hypothetical protein
VGDDTEFGCYSRRSGFGHCRLIASVWHMSHAALVTKRAQAGHVRKTSFFSGDWLGTN